jgi:hypothetical protein
MSKNIFIGNFELLSITSQNEKDAVAMKCAETPIVCSIQKPTNKEQGRAEQSAYSPQEHTH